MSSRITKQARMVL